MGNVKTFSKKVSKRYMGNNKSVTDFCKGNEGKLLKIASRYMDKNSMVGRREIRLLYWTAQPFKSTSML